MQIVAQGAKAAEAAKANAGVGADGVNPWGVMYREEAVARMQRGARRQMHPVVIEGERARLFSSFCLLGFSCVHCL